MYVSFIPLSSWKQLLAHPMGTIVCTAVLLAHLRMKAQFSIVIREHGIPSVITAGAVLMQMWPADNLALARPVSTTCAQQGILEHVNSALKTQVNIRFISTTYMKYSSSFLCILFTNCRICSGK